MKHHDSTATLSTPLRLGAVALALLITGCASTQPVIYHQAAPDAQRAARVAADVEQCRRSADAAVGTNARTAPKAVAASAGRTGAIAFAAEAVEALVEGSRDAWSKARGAAAGGVAGMLTKTVIDSNEPDDVHKEYVERCLKDRGNVVLGWR
jgi:outer membrane murein-binding lipoprotein Lpp